MKAITYEILFSVVPGFSSSGTPFFSHMIFGGGTAEALQTSLRVLVLFTSWLVRFRFSHGLLLAVGKFKKSLDYWRYHCFVEEKVESYIALTYHPK